jgi:hypothetical protein
LQQPPTFPCATLSLPLQLPVHFQYTTEHHRVSQLKSNPTKFQCSRNFNATETETQRTGFKSQTAVFQLSLSFSWCSCLAHGSAHAPHTVCSTVVPHSTTTACPSFLPWPATARPRALRLATLLRGAGLARCWWCQPGRDIRESGMGLFATYSTYFSTTVRVT